MEEQNTLSGTVVLVKPYLINDPDNRKNQVGIIAMASIEFDNVTVRFGHDEYALFSTDALLVLRSQDDIYRDAMNDVTLMPYEDYHDIMDILTFANSPDKTYPKMAVELAMKCPDVLEYTMESLADALGMKRNYGISR